MLTSLALIFLLGIIIGGIFNKLKLPSLIGMIITGIIISPYSLNLLDDSIINISKDLRQIALVIILTRAGLSLNINDLKKIGRPAVLMCFVPATFEMLAVTLIAPMFLNVTYIEAAIMGAVIAAVSPAIIVPRMIRLKEEGYGKKNNIPDMILAGASVDDVFVIVLFTSFLAMEMGSGFSGFSLLKIPISIILGILIGLLLGYSLVKLFKIYKFRDTIKLIIIISISFLLLEVENRLTGIVTMSALLAIMTMAMSISKNNESLGKRLSNKYNKLWVGAEIILFVLVGATVNLEYAKKSGLAAVIIVVLALAIRGIGVYVSLVKTKLNNKEKVFSILAYMPKATVQASIGGIPLLMGLSCGEDVLIVAVISILLTAPIGAIAIDKTYKKLLDK